MQNQNLIYRIPEQARELAERYKTHKSLFGKEVLSGVLATNHFAKAFSGGDLAGHGETIDNRKTGQGGVGGSLSHYSGVGSLRAAAVPRARRRHEAAGPMREEPIGCLESVI